MEKKVYLGCQYGSFKDDKTGRTVRYAHLFLAEPFPESDNPDFNALGYRVDKYKVLTAKLVTSQNLEPLDVVQVFFNSKGAVMDVVKVGRVISTAEPDTDNLEEMLGE